MKDRKLFRWPIYDERLWWVVSSSGDKVKDVDLSVEWTTTKKKSRAGRKESSVDERSDRQVFKIRHVPDILSAEIFKLEEAWKMTTEYSLSFWSRNDTFVGFYTIWDEKVPSYVKQRTKLQWAKISLTNFGHDFSIVCIIYLSYWKDFCELKTSCQK